VNCAAIPDTLLESELFGQVRGAFTGANSNKKGKFALADGGTIFLDEIGTLTNALQAKLLRVLQEREFEPLGAERTQKVDVRVIAATNRDLRAMVGDGRFQEDLFYRLSVIPVELPPLRERRDDIPLLVDHFVLKHVGRTGKRIERVDKMALDALSAYDWPGNVRELENAIERAVVLARTTSLKKEDFGFLFRSTEEKGVAMTMKDVEKNHIGHILELCRWNVSKAASMLEMNRVTLYHKVKKYGLKPEQ
jgi:two-component system response regulator HydG